jgi:hypothetical protein
MIAMFSQLAILLINLFVKNEAKKAEYLKRWQANVDQVNKATTTSIDMKTGYDAAVQDQDARLNEPKQ